MSQMQVVRSDMARAADVARDSAEEARTRGSSDHLAAASWALPGADCTTHLTELGSSWDDDVEGWARDVLAFAEDLGLHADDVAGTDSGARGLLDGLGGLLGEEGDG